MATLTGTYPIDYANTITLSNTPVASLAGGAAAAGAVTVGKRRLIMISARDVTNQNNTAQISFTMGLSSGTAATAPTTNSPFFSLTQSLVFDTGDFYDQIWIGNFHNGTTGADTIDYSVVLLSKY
jgi:hypothetical protein